MDFDEYFNMPDEEMDKPPRKPPGLIALAFLGLCLLLGGAVAMATLARPVESAFTLYAPKPTETPEAGESAGAKEATEPDRPGAEPGGVAFVPTAIVIDGGIVGVLASREAAEAVMDDVVAHFELMILGGGELESELLNRVTYTAELGETDIVASDELFRLLICADTPIRLSSTLVEHSTAYAAFETVSEKDPDLLEGTRIVVSMGRTGETLTLTTRRFLNGVQQGEPETEVRVIREASNAYILIGSKRIDPGAEPGRDEGKRGPSADGLTFAAPAKAKVISNFGQRGGILHLGLDYAGKPGDPVLASSAGIVVTAMERGGYGLMVEIDHGMGFVTRYAHLESALVSIGERVESGAAIGTIGMSGNADEAHLHFEIRVNGRAYNPRFYLD